MSASKRQCVQVSPSSQPSLTTTLEAKYQVALQLLKHMNIKEADVVKGVQKGVDQIWEDRFMDEVNTCECICHLRDVYDNTSVQDVDLNMPRVVFEQFLYSYAPDDDDTCCDKEFQPSGRCCNSNK